MCYQPDVDDENARMDAEQDAKLERAMADREDRVYYKISPRRLGQTQKLIEIIKEELELSGYTHIVATDPNSPLFDRILTSLRGNGLNIKATVQTKKVLIPIYELFFEEPCITGYHEHIKFVGWKIEIDDNDDLPF